MADDVEQQEEPHQSFPGQKATSEFWTNVKDNLRVQTHVWDEIGGSFGDLGTFIPLSLTLAFVNGLDLGTTLVFTGLYNIVTGIVFGTPMPVQPMKYIFAAAISEKENPMTVPQIMAAGLLTASALFLCGVTGLMNVVTRLVPTAVIRGFQLSQGISFGITAVTYILYVQDLTTGEQLGVRGWGGSDGLGLALGALAFVLLASGPGDDLFLKRKSGIEDELFPGRKSAESSTRGIRDQPPSGENGEEEDCLRERLLQNPGVADSVPDEEVSKDTGHTAHHVPTPSEDPVTASLAVPSALIVFLVGLVIAVLNDPGVFSRLWFGPGTTGLVFISWEDWKVGFMRGASAQIPMSLISTVVAVAKLNHTLFPQRKNVTANRISAAVGVFNLIGCPFGTLPVELGAGGLAAQYRFGARDGYAVILLGGTKLFVGLLVGGWLLRLMAQFPVGLLGVILLLAGSELAMFCRDQNTRLDAFVMIICTTAALSGLSAPVGFVCGYATYVILKLRQLLSAKLVNKR